jgi:hypothetical protein
MLDSAIGEAIEISPEKVFQLTQNVFKLNQICGSPDIDNNKYSTYEKAEATVERRIESVKKVDNKALIKLRDGCIKGGGPQRLDHLMGKLSCSQNLKRA